MDPPTLRSRSPRTTINGDTTTTTSAAAISSIEDEQVLILVFRSLNFDPHVVSVAACVSCRLRAIAKRVLWRELCYLRAPRIASAVAPSARVGGSGWHVLAKLLFYCCGSHSDPRIPGHFVSPSRFSKTSGNSFLARKCRGDVLYVSDPCEHAVEGVEEEEVGVYRGVFEGFMWSKTRAWLVGRRVELETRVRCPYCGARVWSMSAARLVPRSAARRLGAGDERRLEYFVCVNGHLHGSCWLLHLSDDDDRDDDDDDEDGDDVAF